MIYYLILLFMTGIGAVASLLLKYASGTKSVVGIIKNKNLYFGGMLYVLSAVLNIYILNYLNYSVVLPLTSFTYVWTMILSSFALGEKITSKKIGGVILIFLGAIIITTTENW